MAFESLIKKGVLRMYMPEVMTIREAAGILKVSEKTLRRVISEKTLPIFWVRGSIRILSSALNEYISNGGVHL